jgi:hypothetical protein
VRGREEEGEKEQVRDPLFGRKQEEWGEMSGMKVEESAQDLLGKQVEEKSQAVLDLPSDSENVSDGETLLECETKCLAASFPQSPSTAWPDPAQGGADMQTRGTLRINEAIPQGMKKEFDVLLLPEGEMEEKTKSNCRTARGTEWQEEEKGIREEEEKRREEWRSKRDNP